MKLGIPLKFGSFAYSLNILWEAPINKYEACKSSEIIWFKDPSDIWVLDATFLPNGDPSISVQMPVVVLPIFFDFL